MQIEAYRCRERALLRDYEALKHRARAAGIDLKAPPPPEAALRSDQPTTSPLQQAAEASAVASASAPTHLALTALNEQHPLWIKTAHGRVRGALARLFEASVLMSHGRACLARRCYFKASSLAQAALDRTQDASSTASDCPHLEYMDGSAWGPPQVPGTLLVAGNELHFVETHARVAPGDYLGLRALKVCCIDGPCTSAWTTINTQAKPSVMWARLRSGAVHL